MMREAKAEKGDLTVVWLDLARSKLIEKALRHYHVPEQVQILISQYFSGMKIRFSTGDITTAWQDLGKGIMTGCTVSPILFNMDMNIIMTGEERERERPVGVE